MHQRASGVGTVRRDVEHVVVLTALDHDHHRFTIGRSTRGRGESGATFARQHRQGGLHCFDPRRLGGKRDEIGFEEVPVVVGVFLGPQGVRASVGLVPVTSFLTNAFTRVDESDLASGFVFDGPAE